MKLIGDIVFKTVPLGRKRIVRFKVANPSQRNIVLGRIYISSDINAVGQDTHVRSRLARSLHANDGAGAWAQVTPVAMADPTRVPFHVISAPLLPFTVPPGHAAEVAVAFIPTAPGSYCAALIVGPEDQGQEWQMVTLQGEGALALDMEARDGMEDSTFPVTPARAPAAAAPPSSALGQSMLSSGLTPSDSAFITSLFARSQGARGSGISGTGTHGALSGTLFDDTPVAAPVAATTTTTPTWTAPTASLAASPASAAPRPGTTVANPRSPTRVDAAVITDDVPSALPRSLELAHRLAELSARLLGNTLPNSPPPPETVPASWRVPAAASAAPAPAPRVREQWRIPEPEEDDETVSMTSNASVEGAPANGGTANGDYIAYLESRIARLEFESSRIGRPRSPEPKSKPMTAVEQPATSSTAVASPAAAPAPTPAPAFSFARPESPKRITPTVAAVERARATSPPPLLNPAAPLPVAPFHAPSRPANLRSSFLVSPEKESAPPPRSATGGSAVTQSSVIPPATTTASASVAPAVATTAPPAKTAPTTPHPKDKADGEPIPPRKSAVIAREAATDVTLSMAFSPEPTPNALRRSLTADELAPTPIRPVSTMTRESASPTRFSRMAAAWGRSADMAASLRTPGATPAAAVGRGGALSKAAPVPLGQAAAAAVGVRIDHSPPTSLSEERRTDSITAANTTVNASALLTPARLDTTATARLTPSTLLAHHTRVAPSTASARAIGLGGWRGPAVGPLAHVDSSTVRRSMQLSGSLSDGRHVRFAEVASSDGGDAASLSSRL